MASFEYLVRPYQSPSRVNPVLDAESVLADNVVVDLNATGGFKSFPFSVSITGHKSGTKYTELSRKTKKVRVENPDDASQFVEINRVQEITLGQEDEPDKNKRQIFKFKDVEG